MTQRFSDEKFRNALVHDKGNVDQKDYISEYQREWKLVSCNTTMTGKMVIETHNLRMHNNRLLEGLILDFVNLYSNSCLSIHIPPVGHASLLQSWLSSAFPSQVTPPFEGAGLVHVRILFWEPVPHVSEQACHSVHSVQCPGTGSDNRKHRKCVTNVSHDTTDT